MTTTTAIIVAIKTVSQGTQTDPILVTTTEINSKQIEPYLLYTYFVIIIALFIFNHIFIIHLICFSKYVRIAPSSIALCVATYVPSCIKQVQQW